MYHFLVSLNLNQLYEEIVLAKNIKETLVTKGAATNLDWQ
jgi:hypothetical protein